MKKLIFKNVGGDDPCSVSIVFNSIEEASDVLTWVIDDFGTENFSCRFDPNKSNKTMTFKMKHPNNTNQSILIKDLIYDENDFFLFEKIPKDLIVVLFCTTIDNKTVSVQYKGVSFLTASYEVQA